MSKHVNKAGGDTLPKRSIFRPKRKVVKISLDTSRNELTIRRICRLGDKVRRQEPHNFQSDKMSFSKEFCRIFLLIWQLRKNGAKISQATKLIRIETIYFTKINFIQIFQTFEISLFRIRVYMTSINVIWEQFQN